MLTMQKSKTKKLKNKTKGETISLDVCMDVETQKHGKAGKKKKKDLKADGEWSEDSLERASASPAGEHTVFVCATHSFSKYSTTHTLVVMTLE